VQTLGRFSLRALRSASTATKLLIVGALVALAAAGAAYAAQPAKPGIALQISPASQSIERAKSASYTVSLTSTGGFAGSVALSASGLPGGASSSFTPSAVTLNSGGTATSALTVTTTSSTPVGSYTITVSGVSGKVSGSVTGGLTVNYPISSSFSMNATPASLSMGPESTAVYTVQLTRSNFPGSVTFAVYGGLPGGATATFTPNPTTGLSSTLQISTAATTPDGSYTLYLVGSGPNPSGATQYAYASVQLIISTNGSPFTISGNLSGLLAPGITLPLNLSLSNPNKKSLSITNLTVTVQSITRTSSSISHGLPCTAADYAVTQYGGPYPLTVPGNGNASLSGLGVASSAWPKVAMLNTTTNQDGCKGAVLTLAYSGSGQGS
jgi:hypothetical protein